MSKFLVGWNDEILSMRLIDGPFGDSKKEEKIKIEVIKMLHKIYNYDEIKSEKIYHKITSEEAAIDDDGEEIDLNIWSDGASLRYGGGEEDRIEVVEYEIPKQI
ncbi:hypothetical protein [Hungatella hathewayi]|uniref:hypothetical protein n=1 Tax=Hungatella hathewayi TaxID=154046 RepID=UPI003568DD0A